VFRFLKCSYLLIQWFYFPDCSCINTLDVMSCFYLRYCSKLMLFMAMLSSTFSFSVIFDVNLFYQNECLFQLFFFTFHTIVFIKFNAYKIVLPKLIDAFISTFHTYHYKIVRSCECFSLWFLKKYVEVLKFSLQLFILQLELK